MLVDFLKSKVSAGAISCATNFSRQQGMLSGPAALQGFRFCSRFLTLLMEVSMSGVSGWGLGPISSRLIRSYSEKTEQNCSLSMLALVLALLCVSLSFFSTATPVASHFLLFMSCLHHCSLGQKCSCSIMIFLVCFWRFLKRCQSSSYLGFFPCPYFWGCFVVVIALTDNWWQQSPKVDGIL